MIVHFDSDIYADQLRAALAASEIDLVPIKKGEYRAKRRDRSCAHCDMPAALLVGNEPVCVRHWRELDKQ
jgi:hypothetical protein